MDLTGKRFGRLTVISDSEKRYKNDNKPIYLCKCDCGNEVYVYYSSLRQGKTKSCGCLARKLASERAIKDLTGKRFGRLIVLKMLIERKNGRVMYLCKCDCGSKTVVSGNNLIAKKGMVKSCGCLRNEVLTNDVIAGTKVSVLTSKLNKNNTSGVKGVSWDKRRNKWLAQIVFKRKQYYLGCYDNLEDATQVRKNAEERLFCEFLKWYESEIKKTKK